MSEHETLPPTIEEDAYLVHYGIKGMQWGKRRADGPDGTVSSASSGGGKDSSDDDSSSSSSSSSTSKQGMTDGQKKALKYAAGGALLAGAIIGTAVLAKNGKIPISSLQNSSFNKNSLAAEVKRMEKIPGTVAYKNKMAKIPGSLQAETKRMAQIPGTLANREAQLAKAAKTSSTMKPEHRTEFMRRVSAKLDAEAKQRATVQANRARLIAEKAQRQAREAEMAARRKIVANQAQALANQKKGSEPEPAPRPSAREILEAMTNAKQIVDSVSKSAMWNQPASNLKSNMSEEQRAKADKALQNGSSKKFSARGKSR